MSDEANSPKKSTKDILAAARAEAARKAAAESGAATPAPEPAAPAETAPAAEAAPAKPKTTAEILAAARAAKAGAAAPAAEAAEPAPTAEAAPATPAAKPKTTADILAAARAAKAGGAAAAPPAGSAPAAKPKSTADILAAARAAKAGAAGAAGPASAPAAAKASPKAVPAAAATGPKLSVQEMLAAVRPAGVAAPAAKPEKAPLVAPPMPAKPVLAKKGAAAKEGRRNVLLALVGTPFALAWTAMTATAGAAVLGMARFMLPNVLTEPPRKFKIGPPTDYDLGTVSTKWVASSGIWVVHSDQYKGKNIIYALASVCTHLGCTPSWLEGEQKFKCPCHGSGFYITGVNFEGPAPRPLERMGLRLADDGMLEVDKSVKFQEEMGQWEDPTSFVEIS